MNAVKQGMWLFFALIACVWSGWYFSRSLSIIPLDAQTLASTPDAIVSGLTIRQFNDQGHLINLLESPKMQHIPNQNTNLFESPHIILTQDNQPSWDIRSQKAHATNKGEQINLSDNVIIHQNTNNSTKESTLKTEALTYFPKQKFATTPLAVSFEQAGSTIHAIGMNAYLDDKRVELLGKTQATYEPNHG